MQFSPQMRAAIRRDFESASVFGSYMAEQCAKSDRHTVVFLDFQEIQQLDDSPEEHHPVFYCVEGDYENLYINEDGMCPTPEQVCDMLSHENLHLVFERMWNQDHDEIELMYASQHIDFLNEIAFEYGEVEGLENMDYHYSHVPALDNTGLPKDLDSILEWYNQPRKKPDTSSFAMYG